MKFIKFCEKENNTEFLAEAGDEPFRIVVHILKKEFYSRFRKFNNFPLYSC